LKSYQEIHKCVFVDGSFNTPNWEDNHFKETGEKNRREYSKQILEFMISTQKTSVFSTYFLLSENKKENSDDYSEDYNTKPKTRGFAYNTTPINSTNTNSTKLSKEHLLMLDDLAPVRKRNIEADGLGDAKKHKKTKPSSQDYDPSDDEQLSDKEQEDEEPIEVIKKTKLKKKISLLERLDNSSMLKWSFSTLEPISMEELR